MKTKDRLELAHWVAQAAQAAGAENAAVDIVHSRAVEMEYRDGQVDKLQESTANSLSLEVYANDRFTSHRTSDLRRDALGEFVRDAVAMTKYLGQDEFRKLPDPKYYQGLEKSDLDLIDPGYDEISSEKRVRMVKELQAMAASKSDKIISTSAGFYDDKSDAIKVHTNGFEGVTQSTSFAVGVEVTLDDGKGGRPSDWYYATTRYLDDMPDADTMAGTAAERALSQLGQTKVESGKYDMLVVNRAAGNPIYSLYGPLTGRSIQQKRSFLDGMLGERIGSEKLTLIDDPFIKRGLGSRHYDREGMVSHRRTIFDKGVLNQYLIDCYYARKLGVDPTGGSMSNVTFEYGDQSLDEMIATIDKGILVTSFIGGNSNPTTGDFSWGLKGMLIEGGKLIKPVSEMNISGNLKDLWSSLVAVGNDPYIYSSFRRPSLHFTNVQFSGI